MKSSSLTSAMILGVLLIAPTSYAQSPTAPGPVPTSTTSVPAANAVTTASPPVKRGALPAFGMMMDVGLPDGMNASLVYRPTRWLRTHAGGSYNMISYGMRGGVALIPFGAGPSLILEGGHYFDGDANGVARKFAGSGYESNALLDRIGYSYANGHLGLELGSRRVTFYIHGGMSFIRATVHNLDSLVEKEATAGGADGATTEVSIKQDPIVKVWTPSAKLGLIVYLW